MGKASERLVWASTSSATRHSAPERARDLGIDLADRLRESGFSVDSVLTADLRPVPAVCVIGRPQADDHVIGH